MNIQKPELNTLEDMTINETINNSKKHETEIKEKLFLNCTEKEIEEEKIVVDINLLKGMIVNEFQAMELAKLLGIKTKL